jgi:hypothetical protein
MKTKRSCILRKLKCRYNQHIQGCTKLQGDMESQLSSHYSVTPLFTVIFITLESMGVSAKTHPGSCLYQKGTDTPIFGCICTDIISPKKILFQEEQTYWEIEYCFRTPIFQSCQVICASSCLLCIISPCRIIRYIMVRLSNNQQASYYSSNEI